MKILLVGNYQPDQQESMLRYAQVLEQTLISEGHQVRLIHPREVAGRIPSLSDEARKWLGYADKFLGFIPELRRGIAWADVVHVCDQGNAFYVPNRRSVLTCHDVFAIRVAQGEVEGVRTRFTGRQLQKLIRWGLSKPKAIVCVSQPTANDLSALEPSCAGKIHVIPNPLNYPYSPMEESAAVSTVARIAPNAGRRFFLHVGNNSWYKNRAGVLRIFAELRKRGPFAGHRLILAGKLLTEELKALTSSLGLEHRVINVGTVSNEELRALYSTAEALIFPSLREGFGWPVVEAQACGCPVFSTNKSPMTEVGGSGARYMNPEVPSEAAALIETELRSRERMVAAGFANVRRFDPREICRSYLNVYRSVLEKTA